MGGHRKELFSEINGILKSYHYIFDSALSLLILERKSSDSSADISTDESESGDEDSKNSKKSNKGKILFSFTIFYCFHVQLISQIIVLARGKDKKTKIFQVIGY